eukprot:6993559-Prymnesium_polylepis.1
MVDPCDDVGEGDPTTRKAPVLMLYHLVRVLLLFHSRHWGLLTPVSRQRGGVMASQTLRLAFQWVDPVTLRGLRGGLLGIWG